MIANLVKNLYDSELESIKRLAASSKKTVSQCENVVPLDCGLEEIKPALTLAKEETKWNLPLDLEKVSETKIFYTREHAQLVNAIAEKITMQETTSRCPAAGKIRRTLSMQSRVAKKRRVTRFRWQIYGSVQGMYCISLQRP